MATEPALKICFCGSAPFVMSDGNGRYQFVKCGNCDRASIHCRTRAEAIEAWNDGGRA